MGTSKPEALRRRKRFLVALEETGNVTLAAQIAGWHRQRAYELRASDPEFAKQWEQAHEVSVEKLEAIARERAKQQSDTLMIFLLKALRPHVYRDKLEVQQSGEVVLKVTYEDAPERDRDKTEASS
jgi:hypothetical protein